MRLIKFMTTFVHFTILGGCCKGISRIYSKRCLISPLHDCSNRKKIPNNFPLVNRNAAHILTNFHLNHIVIDSASLLHISGKGNRMRDITWSHTAIMYILIRCIPCTISYIQFTLQIQRSCWNFYFVFQLPLCSFIQQCKVTNNLYARIP